MLKEKILLNDSQEKAVKLKTGPMLVIAGAGTGKTRVIAQRIKHLIKKDKVSPNDIVALTFTEKAAQEMLQRVDDVMPLGYEEPWINTFHSFADKILKKEGIEIGLDPSYKILSSPEQWLLLRRNIFSLDLDYFRPLGNPTKFISALLKFISRLQDENISVVELEQYSKNFEGDKDEKKRWLELAHVYRVYTDLKIQNSKMDFGDLIVWLIKLFNERPNILKKYQKQFKHLLIDEFQDTNYAQYELIKLLSGNDSLKDRSLLVVGDDSQSIYKFRGASVSNILEFQKDYPSAEMVTLLTNYRSSQNILDSAYKLIRNNNPDTLESKLGISKELLSHKSIQEESEEVDPISVYTQTLEDEVDYVISQILNILGKETSYTYKDIAILARANSHLDPFLMALRKYGLPYQLVGNRGLYDRDEVRDIIALIRIIINPKDSISLYRVLNIDSLDISSELVADALSKSRYEKKDLWEIIKESETTDLRKTYELLTEFQDRTPKETPTEFIFNIVNKLNYLKPLLKHETIENQLAIKNLDLFLNRAKRFEVSFHEETKEVATIVDFIDHLEFMLDAGDDPAQAELEDIDTINLMTVHASKGLEFPVIFMVNLVGGRFPGRNLKDVIEIPDELIKESLPSGNAHLQEERRLFYVGMTRAQKYLYLTGAKNMGGRKTWVPSGYIKETGIKTHEISTEEVKRQNQQKTLFGVETAFRDPKAKKITDGFIPPYLSYSQISTYQECPLQYKYSYILSIPRPPSHALSFGTTVHDTLRDFHQKLLFEDVTLEDLYTIYDKNWNPLGYMDGDHREEYYQNGKNILKNYYEKHIKDPIKPVALEKSFNLRIDGIKFFGRIDRIDPLPDGGVEIIDYKTGGVKDQKYVDKDDQVTFYALGVQEALNLDPKKLSYYYIEGEEKISTTRTQEQIDSKKEEVKETVKKIKSGDFEANPGYHCQWCDFKDICPSAYK